MPKSLIGIAVTIVMAYIAYKILAALVVPVALGGTAYVGYRGYRWMKRQKALGRH